MSLSYSFTMSTVVLIMLKDVGVLICVSSTETCDAHIQAQAAGISHALCLSIGI